MKKKSQSIKLIGSLLSIKELAKKAVSAAPLLPP